MTVTTFNLTTLKQVKNSVIGNPTAKLSLAQDDAFVRRLVDCINNPIPYLEASQGSGDDIRIEAAHVIASLSYGSSNALRSLLSVDAHQAFIYAISRFQPTDPPTLRSAITRALRTLVTAIADAVGPEQWGLRIRPSDIRDECSVALGYLFEVEVLDIYLPLLEDTASHASSSIAQLLGASVRSPPYREAISNWAPPTERNKESKGKRGWEKPEHNLHANCWVVRHLIALLNRKDVKLQEAALFALGSLAKDNKPVAGKLSAEFPDQRAALPHVLSLCKSRNVDLQLAACSCAANIIRAVNHPGHTDHTAPMTVIHVINNIFESSADSPHVRTKACFTLCHLVADDKEMCQLAFDRGALRRLAQLVISITPTEPSNTWDEDEPESISSLREAAFTAIAAISLFENDIRSEVTDNLHLIPYIQTSLSRRHIGVRYAACQCVRALSRAVAVLRTNIVDTGLGMSVFQMFVKALQDGEEDKRVLFAVSAVVCNLVNDFSPLRLTLIEQGVIPKLIQLLHSDDPGLKLNALWAFKNMLFHTNMEVKRQIIVAIGWDELATLMNMDSDPGIQEQAFHMMRHIADTEDGAELVFEGLSPHVLLGFVSNALESDDEDVVRQAVCLLANLANSYPHQCFILSHYRILMSLRSCLVDAKVEVRRPAAACILELVRGNPGPHARKEMHESGIDSTLRHICENYGYAGGGGGGGSPIARVGSGFQMGMEDDKEVKEKAREALHLLDHGSEMSAF